MKKVLITGSSGYIGIHLANMLQNEYILHGIDLVFDSFHLNRFFQMNICAGGTGLLYPKEHHYDTVVHLAAHVKVNESVKIPAEYYYNNIIGTMSVLEQVNFDNFIFASTGVASNPTNPYALSKRCAEDVVKSFCEKRNKNYTTFRFYNVIGSTVKKPTNEDGLFYNLMKAKETGTFTIFGDDYDSFDGTAVRDYVHVDEVCASIKRAIEKPTNSLENLGTGTGYTVKQIVEAFRTVNNCDFEIVYEPRRSGDLERCVLDVPSLYFEKMYSFDEMLKVKP